ncbi:hypothetical protein [Pseudomonas fluorescens]|uniref:hypothetical protein n=1 Tax=Pseudomonas fluorescens TaxID=294 RepID=UPI000999CB13|nr:hypothetical protein [Pseudomonas fluorescens]OPB33497.1 hypothetical protein BFW90_05365 [Pseudomonas fluorescens]
MQISIERRVEIALRSLESAERKKVEMALADLLRIDTRAPHANVNITRLVRESSGKNLFLYKVGREIRLVISFEDDKCIVEDVFYRNRLAGFVGKGMQQ